MLTSLHTLSVHEEVIPCAPCMCLHKQITAGHFHHPFPVSIEINHPDAEEIVIIAKILQYTQIDLAIISRMHYLQKWISEID